MYTQGGENGACHPDVVFLDNPRPDARNALEDGVTCTQDEPEQERLEKVCAHAESHAIPIRNSVWLAEVTPPPLDSVQDLLSGSCLLRVLVQKAYILACINLLSTKRQHVC